MSARSPRNHRIHEEKKSNPHSPRQGHAEDAAVEFPEGVHIGGQIGDKRIY